MEKENNNLSLIIRKEEYPPYYRTFKCAKCGKHGIEKTDGKKGVKTIDDNGDEFILLVVDHDDTDMSQYFYKKWTVWDENLDEYIVPLCKACSDNEDTDDSDGWVDLDKEIDDDVDKIIELFDKGCEYEDKKEFTKALKCYDDAIKLGAVSLYPEVVFDKAGILESMARYEEALECWDLLIADDPEWPQPKEEIKNGLRINWERFLPVDRQEFNDYVIISGSKKMKIITELIKE